VPVALKGVPEYQVVLTEKAAQDYLDELWAEKAAAKFNRNKPGKLYTLDEAKKELMFVLPKP